MDSVLSIWTREGNPTGVSVKCSSSIQDIDLSSDGTQVAVALKSGSTEVRSTSNLDTVWHHSYHNQAPVNTIRFSNDDQYIVSAGSDDYRAILCRADGELMAFLKHANNVISGDFSSDDALIITNSSDGSAKVWSCDGGELQAELRTPSTVNRAIISNYSQFIATASNDGKVRLWDVTGTLLATLPAGNFSIDWISLSDAGDWLVSSSTDGQIYGWNLQR